MAVLGFLDLPFELRKMIYEETFRGSFIEILPDEQIGPWIFRDDASSKSNIKASIFSRYPFAFTLTCKQIRAESLHLLDKETSLVFKWEINSDLLAIINILPKISPELHKRISKLRIRSESRKGGPNKADQLGALVRCFPSLERVDLGLDQSNMQASGALCCISCRWWEKVTTCLSRMNIKIVSLEILKNAFAERLQYIHSKMYEAVSSPTVEVHTTMICQFSRTENSEARKYGYLTFNGKELSSREISLGEIHQPGLVAFLGETGANPDRHGLRPSDVKDAEMSETEEQDKIQARMDGLEISRVRT